MHIALNIVVGLIPIALLCGFVYLRDRARPEKPLHLLITFVLGILFAAPAYLIESQIDATAWDEQVEFVPYTLYVFIGIALVEELCKYLPVLVYPYRQAFFDEPLDGIVYCVFAAMGFATFETVVYAPLLDWQGVLTRVFLSVPAHAAFAMLAGYFLGRARGPFATGRRGRYILLGLLWAVVAHGLYDWFIFNPYAEWMMLLAIVVLIASWGFALRMTGAHARGPEPTPLAEERV